MFRPVEAHGGRVCRRYWATVDRRQVDERVGRDEHKVKAALDIGAGGCGGGQHVDQLVELALDCVVDVALGEQCLVLLLLLLLRVANVVDKVVVVERGGDEKGQIVEQLARRMQDVNEDSVDAWLLLLLLLLLSQGLSRALLLEAPEHVADGERVRERVRDGGE